MSKRKSLFVAAAVAERKAAGLMACRIVDDNGKRWRIESLDGRWEMQPVGQVTAADAEALCQAALDGFGSARPDQMTFASFSAENLARCTGSTGFNHPIDSWSLSDWMTAAFGELGEAANVLKKLNRERDGIKGNTASAEELRSAFADELADTYIYLDLLALAAGIDLPAAIRSKFDRTSAKIGYKP